MRSIRSCPLCKSITKSKRIYGPYATCMQCGHVFQKFIFPSEYYRKLDYDTQSDYINHSYRRGNYIIDFCVNDLITTAYVLDIGCGMGGVMDYFKKHFYNNTIYGITDKKEDVDFARKFLSLDNIMVGDAETGFFVKGNEEKFGFIVMSHFLEHILDPITLMSNVEKVLHKNGLIYIEVPSFYWAEVRIPDVFVPQHVSYYTKSTLKQLLNKVGLKIIKIHESKYWGNIKLLAKRPDNIREIKYTTGEKWEMVLLKKKLVKYLYPYYRFKRRYFKVHSND